MSRQVEIACQTQERNSIVVWPDPRLSEPAAEVHDNAFGQPLWDLLDRMHERRRRWNGYGLAAPQIGIPLRICVIGDTPDEGRAGIELINPELEWTGGAHRPKREGCLSVPGLFMQVERHARLRVHYRRATGERTSLDAHGLLAQVIQHELDHFAGRVIAEQLSGLKRARLALQMKRKYAVPA